MNLMGEKLRRSLSYFSLAIALPNYGEGRSQSLASDLAQGLTQSAMNLMGEKLRRSLSHFSFTIALPNYGEGRSHCPNGLMIELR